MLPFGSIYCFQSSFFIPRFIITIFWENTSLISIFNYWVHSLVKSFVLTEEFSRLSFNQGAKGTHERHKYCLRRNLPRYRQTAIRYP